MNSSKKLYGTLPQVQVADAGYGSEENYGYLDRNGIEAYVKPRDFDREQKGNRQPNWFSSEQLEYNADKDVFICPSGKPMKRVGKVRKKERGFLKTYALYQAKGCNGCPLKDACHKQKGNRVIKVNHRGRKLKQLAADRLKTDRGIYYRKKRPADVEPVFGNIKSNKTSNGFYSRASIKQRLNGDYCAWLTILRKLLLKAGKIPHFLKINTTIPH